MILTLQDLLTYMQEYLTGTSGFSVVRRFVFQFYEAEQDFELDKNLEEVFSVLLPYLHYEEAEGDPDRNIRLRRLYNLLQSGQASTKELVVFALEFDDICQLTDKLNAGLVSVNTYDEQIAKLSPCEYDYNLIGNWGQQHIGEKEPMLEKLK